MGVELATLQERDELEKEVEPEVTENNLCERWDMNQLWEEPSMPKTESETIY